MIKELQKMYTIG